MIASKSIFFYIFYIFILPLSQCSFFDYIVENTYCRYAECCTNEYIPAHIYRLEYLLRENVYGQHLVQEIVLSALYDHFKSSQPKKALTLSFHGWVGSGKNYVADFIAKSLYKNGLNSKYVHQFFGQIHFPEESQVYRYKYNLYNWIKGNVSKCDKQLFIFDEVDKMPPGILDGIKPLMDNREHIDRVDFRRCIFIFLSNTGGTLISKRTIELWESGVRREDIRLHDFENLIKMGAFNEKGGLHKADAIDSNLIDHYVPFFPLEQKHIEMCIRDEFKARDIVNPTKEQISEVMKSVNFGPEGKNIFSTSGCKRLSQKVAAEAKKFQYKWRKNEL